MSNYATKTEIKNISHVDIDTGGFVLKTKYDTDKSEIENKIPNVTDFAKKTKLTELENKIRDVNSLATKTASTSVENKIPYVSSLVKIKLLHKNQWTYLKKLTDHNHDKYITTPKFNTLAADVFNARLAQANLLTKTEFDAKMSSFNRKNTANNTKYLLAKNKLKKLKTFDLSYFIGKNFFEADDTQNCLVFQPMHKYL